MGERHLYLARPSQQLALQFTLSTPMWLSIDEIWELKIRPWRWPEKPEPTDQSQESMRRSCERKYLLSEFVRLFGSSYKNLGAVAAVPRVSDYLERVRSSGAMMAQSQYLLHTQSNSATNRTCSAIRVNNKELDI